MNIVKQTDGSVVVELEDKVVRYAASRTNKKNYLTGEGVEKLEEWKIDLIENYGVGLDEL